MLFDFSSRAQRLAAIGGRGAEGRSKLDFEALWKFLEAFRNRLSSTGGKISKSPR